MCSTNKIIAIKHALQAKSVLTLNQIKAIFNAFICFMNELTVCYWTILKTSEDKISIRSNDCL